ncbi:hydroxyisourate hydrolase [Archangium lansingense]|uniref:5-hydroxyisourate hydrolase n=1 Tax=Archangium lansingense TaxID=2995310 RepID=A0ABT4ABG7_9BACT|nr:hydroxyisourate hydrolase [Archangium lansinium]MCY1078970.1 hydroxyisourate hydrolase [Archangium lansinium]
MGISTHILDTSRGRPAEGVTVKLYTWHDGSWNELVRGVTNADGRVKPLLETIPAAGVYRLQFEIVPYFARFGIDSFYPSVSVEFRVTVTSEHYHVPLLLNPFGYSTYRGS